MARGELRVGCSGWLYRDWRGIVYPAELTAKQWFPYYTTQFDTYFNNDYEGNAVLDARWLRKRLTGS